MGSERTANSVNHHDQEVKTAFTSFEPSSAYKRGMDLGFDPNELHYDASRKTFAGDCLLAPEWHDLMPRLFAGWSARREMMRAGAHKTPRRGNFDPACAQVLAGIEHGSRAVNQAALGNRKPQGSISIDLAGNIPSGDRG